MNKIWMNRLIAGTQQWADVPTSRRNAVYALLVKEVENGKITQEQLESIVNED